MTTKMKKSSKCEKLFEATTEYFYKGSINSFGEVLLKGRCKVCCRPSLQKGRESSKIFYDRHREAICLSKMKKNILKKQGVVSK